MTTICMAFDNIRLIRRKIRIAEDMLQSQLDDGHRDVVLIQLNDLTRDLLRAMHDFADMGYEDRIAQHLTQL